MTSNSTTDDTDFTDESWTSLQERNASFGAAKRDDPVGEPFTALIRFIREIRG
jgi:hypothetical protein